MKRFSFDYMNAAGYAKSVDHVRKLAQVPLTTHIVVGGITCAAQEGNTGGTNFVQVGNDFFNSLGLPNKGKEWLRSNLPEMCNIAIDTGKKLVVNISGGTPQEYVDLGVVAHEGGADIVELNLSCPNKFGPGGKQSDMFAFDVAAMDMLKVLWRERLGTKIETWWKLSPYANPMERVRIAQFLYTTDAARVTLCNTFPNARPRDKDSKLLVTAKNTNGRAGLSGEGLRIISQINVEHFRELLPTRIGINGAGGIDSGTVLEEYRQLGCDGMQVAGAFMINEDVSVLHDIAAQWADNYFPVEAEA
ncbi:MAG: dihydroorotate oxidase [Candidatus Adlerbacteria bacterium]|nr:dihydroorotate oxidase [Candidatus Adlerbacteria bacterium]